MHARRHVDVAVVADQQAVVRIERARVRPAASRRQRRGQRAGAGDVADVRLEVLRPRRRSPSSSGSAASSGSCGLKVPFSGTDLRGPALNDQTTPSVRPLKWQLAQLCQPSLDSRSSVETVRPPAVEVAARGEEHLRADLDLLVLRAGRRQRSGRGSTFTTWSVVEVRPPRRCARRSSSRRRALPPLVDRDALRVLAGVVAAGGRVGRVVQVDVAGRVGVRPVKLQLAGRRRRSA